MSPKLLKVNIFYKMARLLRWVKQPAVGKMPFALTKFDCRDAFDMMTLKKISTTSLIAGTLLLGTAAQAEMINLTDQPRPEGTTTPVGTCPSGPGCIPANTSGSIGAVSFFVDQDQPTGTGVFDPFLRIQQHSANEISEQGYNTSGGTPLQDKPPPGVWTRDLLMSSLLKEGGSYTFLLDIDEKKAQDNNLLSLDGVKLYAVNFTTSPTGEGLDGSGDWDIANGPGNAAEFINYQLLWDMDADGDNAVLLDSNREIPGSGGALNPPGNGTMDMRMEVPDTIITDTVVANYTNFILWSRFGLLDPPIGGAKSTDSFEEWSARVCEDCGGAPPSNIPTPAPLAMLVVGLALLGRKARRPRV